ncbi:MAG TPA: hypothetical protein VMM56_17420 [Planctomycetaceae bacterium]|nr:hypothetical protein [Planctomycetaceae bacterium]
MNPSDRLDPRLLTILAYLTITTTACVVAFHYLQAIPLQDAARRAAGKPSSSFVSIDVILSFLPVLHLLSLVLCFSLLAFLVYAYRVRASQVPGRMWPLGLACLCLGFGLLISLFVAG